MAADHANHGDLAAAGRHEQRETDRRNRAVVYRVLVDHYVPSADLVV